MLYYLSLRLAVESPQGVWPTGRGQARVFPALAIPPGPGGAPFALNPLPTRTYTPAHYLRTHYLHSPTYYYYHGLLF